MDTGTLPLARWRDKFIDGSIFHAVLIAGDAGSGRDDFVRSAAALFLTGAEDGAIAESPYLIASSAGELNNRDTGVEYLRVLLGRLNARAFGHGRRCFVLTDVDRLNERCQNALLKTLEEPGPDTLLLLSGVESGCLLTIRSRCMIVRIGALPPAEVERALIADGTKPECARRAALLSDGLTAPARRFAQPDFVDFMNTGAELLLLCFSPVIPFERLTALVSRKLEDEDGGKKKLKPDPALLSELIGLWLRILRDSLVAGYGAARFAPELAETENIIGERFTRAQISSMISALSEAEKELYYRASAGMTLDRLAVRLARLARQA